MMKMESINDIRISRRIIIAFGLALFSLVIVIVVGLIDLHRVDGVIDVIANSDYPKTVYANNIMDGVDASASAFKDYLLVTDQTGIAGVQDEITKSEAEIKSNEARLESALSTGRGRDLFNDFDAALHGQYSKDREEIKKDLLSGKRKEAVAIMSGDYATARAGVEASLQRLIGFENQTMHAEGQVGTSTYNSSVALDLLFSLIAIGLVIITSRWTAGSIVTPLRAVMERVEQLQSVCITNLGSGLAAMAAGDLTARVEKATKPLNFKRKDEIGIMAATVDQMIHKSQAGIDQYENVRDRINDLISETGRLIEDSKNGLLSNRGDVTRFKGAYKEIVEGVNDMLDAVILPVKEGADVLAVMAKGDLTVRVEGDYKGDHQLIKNSINKLGDSLTEVLAEVNEAIQGTASASTQISSSTEEMAAGAQEQSAQAAEVATAVEEMTKTIIETTRNAAVAADSAKGAGRTAENGGAVVKGTISGMDRVAEVVGRSSEKIKMLGRSSDQIGEIIQVIDDIADQTNLLALNAAIEAARAGEQGRGFAVVADEVRKLAERTTSATKEIADMIKRIQIETGEVVEAIDEGTAEVQNGKKMADEASVALGQIITGAQDVVDMITQVASAGEEQSSAAEQISKNIEAISTVSQQSAMGTQQIARAADDLNRLTDNLQELIAKFTIDRAKSFNSPETGGQSDGSSMSVRANGVLVNS